MFDNRRYGVRTSAGQHFQAVAAGSITESRTTLTVVGTDTVSNQSPLRTIQYLLISPPPTPSPGLHPCSTHFPCPRLRSALHFQSPPCQTTLYHATPHYAPPDFPCARSVRQHSRSTFKGRSSGFDPLASCYMKQNELEKREPWTGPDGGVQECPNASRYACVQACMGCRHGAGSASRSRSRTRVSALSPAKCCYLHSVSKQAKDACR